MKKAFKGLALFAAAVLIGAGCTSSASVQGTPSGATVNTGINGGLNNGY
jgi:F0F1-type ATP synthase membrane subunit c/vacuolar-type H+-ATPase subunit K